MNWPGVLRRQTSTSVEFLSVGAVCADRDVGDDAACDDAKPQSRRRRQPWAERQKAAQSSPMESEPAADPSAPAEPPVEPPPPAEPLPPGRPPAPSEPLPTTECEGGGGGGAKKRRRGPTFELPEGEELDGNRCNSMNLPRKNSILDGRMAHLRNLRLELGKIQVSNDKEGVLRKIALKLEGIVESETRKRICNLVMHRKFITTPSASIFFGVIIMINAVFVGVEIEVTRENSGSVVLVCFIIESAFLILFILELCLRLRAASSMRAACSDCWNIFDFALILPGVLDTWVLQFIFISMSSRGFEKLTVLRLVRLARAVRVLRVVRLLRFCHELLLLTQGILAALQALIWSLFLITMILYISAVLTTSWYVQMGVHDGFLDTEAGEAFAVYYGSVGRSCLTLFQLMTLEGWPHILRTSMEAFEHAWAFIVPFIMVTNFSLLNAITAVVVEKVFCIAQNHIADEAKRSEKKRMAALGKLKQLFSNMDVDHNNNIELEEFRVAMKEKRFEKQLLELGITGMDADELFQCLDLDGNEELSVAEFVDGCLRVVGPAQSKHLLQLQYDLLRNFKSLQSKVNELSSSIRIVLKSLMKVHGKTPRTHLKRKAAGGAASASREKLPPIVLRRGSQGIMGPPPSPRRSPPSEGNSQEDSDSGPEGATLQRLLSPLDGSLTAHPVEEDVDEVEDPMPEARPLSLAGAGVAEALRGALWGLHKPAGSATSVKPTVLKRACTKGSLDSSTTAQSSEGQHKLLQGASSPQPIDSGSTTPIQTSRRESLKGEGTPRSLSGSGKTAWAVAVTEDPKTEQMPNFSSAFDQTPLARSLDAADEEQKRQNRKLMQLLEGMRDVHGYVSEAAALTWPDDQVAPGAPLGPAPESAVQSRKPSDVKSQRPSLLRTDGATGPCSSTSLGISAMTPRSSRSLGVSKEEQEEEPGVAMVRTSSKALTSRGKRSTGGGSSSRSLTNLFRGSLGCQSTG